MTRARCALLLLALLAAASAGGCGQAQSAAQNAKSPSPEGLPAASQVTSIPLGDMAGAAEAQPGTVRNPFENDPAAIERGHKLFVEMNCAGCHAYTAVGAMGPNLTDSYWRYGGEPVQIFKSISEGRPQGMPAWGKAMPPEDIWRIVAYIDSISSSQNAAKPITSSGGGDVGQTEGTGLGGGRR